LAAIRPVGVDARWQLSQVVLDGMCALAPAGLVVGMPTMLVMPVNTVVLPAGRWQSEHFDVMPLWLINEPLNLAPLTTGVAATLEPAPTWHASHAAVVGIWLPGMPTMLKLAAGIAKLAAAGPWHCAQLMLVDCALAWMAVSVGSTE
jgi:hypothetical protein